MQPLSDNSFEYDIENSASRFSWREALFFVPGCHHRLTDIRQKEYNHNIQKTINTGAIRGLKDLFPRTRKGVKA